MASYSFRQSSHHQADHANPQHRFAMVDANLVVATQPPRFEKPTKGSFYNPAFGQHFKTFDAITAPHDFQFQLAIGAKLFDPSHQGSQIAAVGPDDLQASKQIDQSFDQAFGGVPILHGSRSDHNGQHQAQGVHRHMPFAALDLFARVIASLACLIGRFNRLAVNDSRRRNHLAPFGFAQDVPQRVMDE